MPPPPPLSAQLLRERALAGGRFLVAHLAPNGRYIYEHDLPTGAQTDPRGSSYSMPRHAGTTYFLAELYRITKEPWLREPIERAFAHLAELMGNGRCAGKLPDGTEIDCVMDRSERVAQLGSTALAVVAPRRVPARHRRHALPRPWPASWPRGSSWMQRPDGSFRHLYNPVTKQADDKTQLLYYSGEASLALARMHAITGEAPRTRARPSAGSTGWWAGTTSSWAASSSARSTGRASPPRRCTPPPDTTRYVDFCHGYGAFLRGQQAAVGEHPDEDDLAGSYSFTPFLLPYNTPAGSRTEAMISAYLLGRHHGRARRGGAGPDPGRPGVRGRTSRSRLTATSPPSVPRWAACPGTPSIAT